MRCLALLALAAGSARGGQGVMDVTSSELDDTTAFEFKNDLGGFTLGAVMASVAQRLKASYTATPKAQKMLKQRWAMTLEDAAGVGPEGGTLVIPWSRIQEQLQALRLKEAKDDPPGVEVSVFERDGARSLVLSSKREHLLVADSAHVMQVRGALNAFAPPPGIAVTSTAYEHAGAILFEGSPKDLRVVEAALPAGALKNFKVLHADETGQYALHYRLRHAWATTRNVLKGADGVKTSAMEGIAGTLSEMLKDYNEMPKVKPTDRPPAAGGSAPLAHESETTTRLKSLFQAARIPGFETLAQEPGPAPAAPLQIFGVEVSAPQAQAAPAAPRTQEVAVPLHVEVEKDSFAQRLTPVGAGSTMLVGQGGTMMEVLPMSVAQGEDARVQIENKVGAKLVTLDAVQPATGTAHTEDAPDVAASSVLGDHVNNALIVLCPAISEVWRVHHLLQFLEHAVGILDEPLSMVELSTAIIDIDTSHLSSWGSRFAIGKSGDINGHAMARGGFDVPGALGGNPRSPFSLGLDPAAGGIERITAESVAGEAFNVGALIVGSSTKLLATLSALEADGDGRVLSRPSVVTLDGTSAEVTETTTFYLASTALNSSGLTAVAVPLSVVVTPQVVELTQGVSSKRGISMRLTITDGTAADTSKVDYGAITTSAIVVPGESLLVAGRLRDDQQQKERRVPFLGRIPGLSRLFKNGNSTTSKQQRMVMVTPTIVDVYNRTSMGPTKQTRQSNESAQPQEPPIALTVVDMAANEIASTKEKLQKFKLKMSSSVRETVPGAKLNVKMLPR